MSVCVRFFPEFTGRQLGICGAVTTVYIMRTVARLDLAAQWWSRAGHLPGIHPAALTAGL